MAAVSPTASSRRACAARSARSARPRFLGSTWMTNALLPNSAFGRLVLELDRAHRHHGGDRVLVDQLALAVAAQQDAEIVEPGDVALELHAIDQKDGDGAFGFADSVEERVLKVLLFIAHGFAHCFSRAGVYASSWATF